MTFTEQFCPTDWIYVNKRCVGKSRSIPATYEDSRASCETQGGSLYEMKSDRELQRVVARLALG